MKLFSKSKSSASSSSAASAQSTKKRSLPSSSASSSSASGKKAQSYQFLGNLGLKTLKERKSNEETPQQQKINQNPFKESEIMDEIIPQLFFHRIFSEDNNNDASKKSKNDESSKKTPNILDLDDPSFDLVRLLFDPKYFAELSKQDSINNDATEEVKTPKLANTTPENDPKKSITLPASATKTETEPKKPTTPTALTTKTEIDPKKPTTPTAPTTKTEIDPKKAVVVAAKTETDPKKAVVVATKTPNSSTTSPTALCPAYPFFGPENATIGEKTLFQLLDPEFPVTDEELEFEKIIRNKMENEVQHLEEEKEKEKEVAKGRLNEKESIMSMMKEGLQDIGVAVPENKTKEEQNKTTEPEETPEMIKNALIYEIATQSTIRKKRNQFEQLVFRMECAKEFVDQELSKSVLSNYSSFVNGMLQVQDISYLLTNTSVMCHNGRKNIHKVQDEQKRGNLAIIQKYRSLNNMKRVIAELQNLKKLMQSEKEMFYLVNTEQYPQAIRLMKEFQRKCAGDNSIDPYSSTSGPIKWITTKEEEEKEKIDPKSGKPVPQKPTAKDAKTPPTPTVTSGPFAKYACFKKINENLNGQIRVFEKKLESSLISVCGSFNSKKYEKILIAFAVVFFWI